jgi:dephospho-CoA kinase
MKLTEVAEPLNQHLRMLNFIKHHCIALTGGIATGKPTVGNYLRSIGYNVIDADWLSRLVSRPGWKGYVEVLKAFGNDILVSGGEPFTSPIDRRKVGAIVFNDPVKMKLLNDIIHPIIEEEFHAHIEILGLTKEPKIFFYEIPLLFELGKDDDFREIWCTYCLPALQLERLMERNGFTEFQRIQAQVLASDKAKRSNLVIYTDPDYPPIEEQLENEVRRLPTLLPQRQPV